MLPILVEEVSQSPLELYLIILMMRPFVYTSACYLPEFIQDKRGDVLTPTSWKKLNVMVVLHVREALLFLDYWILRSYLQLL